MNPLFGRDRGTRAARASFPFRSDGLREVRCRSGGGEFGVVLALAGLFFSFMAAAQGALAQDAEARPVAVVSKAAKHASTEDPRESRKALLRRARAGDAEAMLRLGDAYAGGAPGLKKSLSKAASWYRKAAQAGSAKAAHRLALLLLKGGEGVRRAPKVAAALFLAAAKKGHVPSMHWLAYMLERGIGLPRDVAEARKWYEKAAEKGHVPAQVALGVMALTGQGMARDFERARDYFSMAAEKRDGWALNNLGAMFEMGWGVLKDREKAVIYYELARERNNPAAVRNLVRLGELPADVLQAVRPADIGENAGSAGPALSGRGAMEGRAGGAAAEPPARGDVAGEAARPVRKRVNFRPAMPKR